MKGVYGTNNPAPSIGTGDFRSLLGQAVGSCNFWAKVGAITGTRLLFSTGWIFQDFIGIGLVADDFFCEVRSAAGVNRYRLTVNSLAPQSLRPIVDQIVMFTVVQDGLSLKLYINGQTAAGNTVELTAGAGAATDW